MKSLAAKILSSLCKQYINDIDETQLNLLLLQGIAELQNIKIKSSALSIHDLPFTVTDGTIQSLKLHFPWTQLYAKPCEISIEGIHIVAFFTKNIEQKTESEMKKSVLEEVEKACQQETKSKEGFAYQLFSSIIDNIIFTLKDIHIQVELKDSENLTTIFTTGIYLDEINCYTINDLNEPAFTSSSNLHLKKSIVIKDFNFYIDSPESRNNGNDHEYIIKSFSSSSLFERTKNNSNQTKTEISHNISNLTFRLNRTQLKAMGECLYQQNMYNLRKKFFRCGHPDSLPRSQRSSGKWWRFCHRCTIEKRYPNRFNIQQTIAMLKIRHQYLNLSELKSTMSPDSFESSQYYNEIQEIQESLDLDTILFLRSYCKYKTRIKNEMNTNNENSDINMTEINQILSENSSITTSLMSLAIDKAEIQLFDSFTDNNSELQIGGYGLKGSFSKNINRQSQLSINCGLFKIFSQDKVIFQQGQWTDSSQTMPKESIFSLQFKSSPQNLENELVVYSLSPFINVDVKLLIPLKRKFIDGGLKSYPSAALYNKASAMDPSLFDSQSTTQHVLKQSEQAKFILQKKCDEYPYFKVSMKLSHPDIRISGTKLEFKMDNIEFDSFPTHERSVSKIETVYNDYQCTFKGFSILLNEKSILNPVTTTVKIGSIITPVEWLDRLKIEINMSSISVNLSKPDYVAIVSGINSLMALPQTLSHQEHETIKAKEHKFEPTIIDKLMTKITLVIQEIALDLESIGQFRIIDLYSLIGMNAVQSDIRFKLHNIQCLSTQKKYIDFNVNNTQLNSLDFSHQNNAIVGNLTLCTNHPMKAEVFIESPIIVIDIEWIEQVTSFFTSAKFNLYSKADENARQDEHVYGTTNNLISIKLNRPQLNFILPTIDKENEQIQIILAFESIDIDQLKKLYNLSNLELKVNNRIISQNSCILFSNSTIHTDFIELNLEELDYPLFIEFISYITNLYSYYFPPKKEEKAIKDENESAFQIDISMLHCSLRNHISIQLDDALLTLSDLIQVELHKIFVFDLLTSESLFESPQLIVKNEKKKLSFTFSPSTSLILADSATANFLFNYFTKDYEKRINFEPKKDTQKVGEESSQSFSFQFNGLDVIIKRSIFKFAALNILMQFEQDKKIYQVKSQKVDNPSDRLITFDSLAFKRVNKLVDLDISNLDLNYDLNRITEYSSFISSILSDNSKLEKNDAEPLSIPDFIFKINLSKSIIRLSTIIFAINKVELTNKEFEYSVNVDTITFSSSYLKQSFLSISNSSIVCTLDIKTTQSSLPGDNLNIHQVEKELISQNYLNGYDVRIEIDSLTLVHDYNLINDFCFSLNSFLKKETNSKSDLHSVIALNINNCEFTIPQYKRKITLKSIIFNKTYDYSSFQIGSIQFNTKSLQLLSNKQQLMAINMDETTTEISLSDTLLTIDINSLIIMQLFKTIINSPFLTKLNLFNSNTQIESGSSKFMKLSLQNTKMNFVNNDILLSISLSIKYISNDSHKIVNIPSFTASFFEKQQEYQPIIKNLGIEFQMNDKSINASLTNLTFSMCPSDIIDLREFYRKIMTLYSRENKKQDNDSNQSLNFTPNISVNFSDLLFLLNENNRQTTVPFPFFKFQCTSNSFILPISAGATKFELPIVIIELFNDKQQKWNTLIEPFAVSIDISFNKSFVIGFPLGLNLIISYDIIKRIKNFSFTRQKFCVKPDYIIENNSNDEIPLRFSDNSEKFLVPKKTIDLYNQQMIIFNQNNQIDLQRFFTPQYYQDKFSISLFNKNDFRFLSFNSLFLIRNKSSLPLIYHDLITQRIINVNPTSISPIDIISAIFFFDYNSPSTLYQTIELISLKSQPNQIIPIFVNNVKYYYKLQFKFSQKRNVFIITLEPHYTIYQCFKYPIDFIIPTKCKLTIKPNVKQYLDHASFENSLEFSITYQNQQSRVTSLDLQSCKRDLPISFSNKIYFSLSFYNSEICIKPIALLKNRMNHTISIYDTRSVCISSVSKGQRLSFGTYDYFTEKKLFVYFKISQYHTSEKIEIKHRRLELYLKSKTNDLYLPIIINTTLDKHGIYHIAVNYLYYVRNKTNDVMILQPLNMNNEVFGNPMTIEPNTIIPITACTHHLQYCIGFLEMGTIPAISLKNRNINQLKQLTIRVDTPDKSMKLVEMNYLCSNRYLFYTITFKQFGFPQPLMISNMLSKQPIRIINCNLDVLPMSTSSISTPSLETLKSLDILFYNKVITISLCIFEPFVHDVELLTKNLGKVSITLFSEIVLMDNGCRLVVISEKRIQSKDSMNLTIDIPQLSISILNDATTELALINLTRILWYKNSNSNKIDTYFISVDGIQIDDMFPDTENQSFFLNVQKPFLSIEASKLASSKMAFKNISCKISPSAIVLKENFVADAMHFFELVSHIQSKKNKEDEIVNDQSSIMWIDELTIHPISFDISGIPNSNRPKIHSCKYDDVLSKIPNISHFDISTILLNIKGFHSTSSNLLSILSDHAISAIEMISLSIMNHALEYAIKYTSNLIHRNDAAEDKKMIKDMSGNMTPLAQGLMTGLSGLITHPINAYKRDGHKGLLTGIAKGVAGAFIDIANGAINEKNRELDKRIKKPLIRIPRALNFNNQIIPFDPQAAICQLLFQRKITNYCEYFIFYVNGNRAFFGISQNYMVVFSKRVQNNQPARFIIESTRKLTAITNYSIEGCKINLAFGKSENPLSFHCQSPQIAYIGSKIVFSRIYINKLMNS